MIPDRKRGLAAVRQETPRLGQRLLSPAGLLELYPAITPRTLRRWIQQAAPTSVRSQGQEKVLPGNGLGPIRTAPRLGFDIDDAEIHPALMPHQRAIVRWMIAGGRRACFGAFGLGKTVIQLEAVRICRERAGGKALIVIPLGVRQEFIRDAESYDLSVAKTKSAKVRLIGNSVCPEVAEALVRANVVEAKNEAVA